MHFPDQKQLSICLRFNPENNAVKFSTRSLTAHLTFTIFFLNSRVSFFFFSFICLPYFKELKVVCMMPPSLFILTITLQGTLGWEITASPRSPDKAEQVTPVLVKHHNHYTILALLVHPQALLNISEESRQVTVLGKNLAFFKPKELIPGWFPRNWLTINY